MSLEGVPNTSIEHLFHDLLFLSFHRYRSRIPFNHTKLEIMAPSATDTVVPVSKVEISKKPEKHVHGREDKTPLEAISHGELVLPGMFLSFVLCL